MHFWWIVNENKKTKKNKVEDDDVQCEEESSSCFVLQLLKTNRNDNYIIAIWSILDSLEY